ncbi:PaaI family thioesterase [Tsukamurella sp. USMM236]|uniref:PaaI family thioesterase n=1 Tax=Tsukamurella sp. USMM236 TaxID=3081301 RepID=UPI003015B00E
MSDTEGIVDRRAEFPKFTPVTPPPSYGAFVEAMRDLMDLAVASDADDAAYALAAEQIRRASATLAPHREATEAAGPASRVPELPGRGNPMQIPWRMERFDGDGIRSIVRFRRAHLGGHSAAHGGMIAQLFDEHLGWIVYSGGHPIARTAYLKVDYRKVTPLDTDLVLDGWIDRVEGRKIHVTARLTETDGTALADCEALIVALLPHNA